ncbi:hypothetical protein [Bacillus infantis]|uniref:Uncharacterized protein n=1 Tax=Bacillus infantis TaxID=324767 RepID=A0A5D4RL73_9BACI|nr:hypothetical protein [Bacillus infantis]TYS52113.1 hypothetical protein FZD51_01315 [Bacillus infantis]
MKKVVMKRKVQQAYQNKMLSKKKSRKQTFETGVVFIGIVLLFSISGPLQQETGKAYRMKGEQVGTWSMPASEIQHKLSEFEGFKGIAIDTHPKPVKYIIKTSFNSDAASAARMIDEAHSIISTANDEAHKEVYQIVVRGMENEVLERKEYP